MTVRFDLIARIGEALYGESRWRAPLAEALRVSERTLKRWELGERSVPRGVLIECGDLLHARGIEIEEVEYERLRRIAE